MTTTSRQFRLLLFGHLVALFVALLCNSANAATVVRVGGTGSGLPVLKVLAKAYSKTHPDVAIRVIPSLGSSGGIEAVAQGALDLAVSARPLLVAELQLGTRAVEFARTPFVFAVHKDVPKTDMKTEDLVKIYSGKMATWPNGVPIRLILRPINDTDTHIVRSISPDLSQAVESAHQRPGMTLAATNDDSADAVTRVPGAFTVASLTEMVTDRRNARILSYNGVKPTLPSLCSGKYPLVKRLYLVKPKKPSVAARDFAAFILSPQAHAILTASGNIPASAVKERAKL